MTRKEWKEVQEVRIEVVEKCGTNTFSWSFPIRCPRWLFNLLTLLER